MLIEEFEGVKIYDPRTAEYVVSNNPALIMVELIVNRYIITDLKIDDGFWQVISELADACDQKIKEQTN